MLEAISGRLTSATVAVSQCLYEGEEAECVKRIDGRHVDFCFYESQTQQIKAFTARFDHSTAI